MAYADDMGDKNMRQTMSHDKVQTDVDENDDDDDKMRTIVVSLPYCSTES